MALSAFPILFDGTEIPWPNPDTWNENPEDVETVGTTEAGTDQVLSVRRGKFSASGTWNCSDVWAKKFREYYLQDSVAVSLYDIIAGEYQVIPCRIRNFRAALVGNSQRTAGTNGLYVVSFDLIAF